MRINKLVWAVILLAAPAVAGAVRNQRFGPPTTVPIPEPIRRELAQAAKDDAELKEELARLYPNKHDRDVVTWQLMKSSAAAAQFLATVRTARMAAQAGDRDFVGNYGPAQLQAARRDLAVDCGKLAATAAPVSDAERVKAYDQLEGWAASILQAKEPVAGVAPAGSPARELCRAETLRLQNEKPAADPRRLSVKAPPAPPSTAVTPPASAPAAKTAPPRTTADPATAPKPAPKSDTGSYIGAGVGAAGLGVAGMLLLGPVGLIGGLLLGGLLGWSVGGDL